MKITFLCPDIGVGGGIRVILAFADRLAGRGHDVEVVVPAGRRLKALWRAVRGIGPEWLPKFRASIRWVKQWVPGDLPQGDVIVATWWVTAPIAAEAPPRCGAKFYLIQHYESLYLGPPELVDSTYRLPLRKIVVSTWLRDIMHEKFGTHAEVLIPPVDLELFRPVPRTIRMARPRVLMMHSETPWKGVADGLEAVAIVKQKVPELYLVGFGVKPPPRPSLYDEFHTDPPQEELAALYSGCDIYLCSSWDEGLGLPAMEAMACGAALVTYDTGGCRDYARDGKTALVARRRDVADLGVKLERMAVDTELRARIAADGMAFVRTAFNWDNAVRQMEELFEDGMTPAKRLRAT